MIGELKTVAKLLAVCSDNAPELKYILDEWCSTIGIESQYTEAYTSRQNDIPKRDVRTTENNIRPMIKKAGLPMEFWSEAAATDAYIRNRVGTGPVVDGGRITPIEAFEGVKMTKQTKPTFFTFKAKDEEQVQQSSLYQRRRNL